MKGLLKAYTHGFSKRLQALQQLANNRLGGNLMPLRDTAMSRACKR